MMHSIGRTHHQFHCTLREKHFIHQDFPPLLHIDTKWKFNEMIKFGKNKKEIKFKLITLQINQG